MADAGLSPAGSLCPGWVWNTCRSGPVNIPGEQAGARPGRKMLSLAASMLLGGAHIDHADAVAFCVHPEGVAVFG